MSADLFAEFSAPPSKPQQPSSAGNGQTSSQPKPTFSFFDDLGGAVAPAPIPTGFQSGDFGKNDGGVVDEADDWGDFEGGGFESAPAAAPTLPAKQDPFAFSAPVPNDPFAFPGPAITTQTAWLSNSAGNDPFAFTTTQPTVSSQVSWTPAPVVKAKKSANPSVLFDAEDDFDDDDFGDFEGTLEQPSGGDASKSLGGAVDLLGDLSLSPKPAAPMSISRKKSPASGFGTTTRKKDSQAGPPLPIAKQDDSWDNFDDWEASIPSKAPTKIPGKQSITSKSTKTPPPILSPTFDDAKPGELPPTNVPPPAVLLTLFPALFTEAQNKLFKPMAAQTLPMRNKLLSEPATIAYLQGYMMLAAVAAQIIAGRKLRWKRDQHLSQGMRIGPASSRATSGMKLSTVDKSENMKEEREALDVVRAWKDQVGRLRHVVSAANQNKAGTLGAVPDIQETMPVKVLKQGEGGVPAPQACMLCGLKRDERVGAADQGVEDSFGEWWIEQVNMHRGCRNFWNEHREKLRQR